MLTRAFDPKVRKHGGKKELDQSGGLWMWDVCSHSGSTGCNFARKMLRKSSNSLRTGRFHRTCETLDVFFFQLSMFYPGTFQEKGGLFESSWQI